MNRSNTTLRSFSTDQLRAALGDVGGSAPPDYLTDVVAQAGRTRQRPAWTFLERWLSMDVALRRQGVPRTVVVFAVLSLLVALFAAGVVYIGSILTHLDRPPRLPATLGAWERVLIETPSVTGRVASLAVSPRGLLAAVGGDEPARLVVSTDGRNWTLVPEGLHPKLSNDCCWGMPTVVGTERGFLLLQFDEVWTSENGYDWRRLASSLRLDAAAVGGPGLTAVGVDKAWYSREGSNWTLAAVPPLPEEIRARPESERYVGMTGITAAGNDLVAWGIASVPLADNPDEHLEVPLVWASRDGRTWASVVDPEMDSVSAVAGGPGGFVAAGQAGSEAAVWLSADGEAWERVGEGAFTSQALEAAAATNAGYVVVGGNGVCPSTSCPDRDIVIWTSADGRSWSRVPSADLFAGAKAYGAFGWGSGFVVGGASDEKPAIWISGHERSGSGANSGVPTASIATPTRAQPVNFVGTWKATDPPPDSSHLTMEVVALPNGSFQVTVRDDFASVCDGATSTMTGVAESRERDTIVIAQPQYICDDGSKAQALSGPPLDEQLRNFSFSYDSLRDALFDPAGLEWTRIDVAP
jgi:hypothetical protein